MVRVAPIRLQYSSKVLWFAPEDFDVQKGDAVVVTTARGLEFGHLTDEIFEVEQDKVKRLKADLKPIKRIATERDKEMAAQMQEKSDEALPVFKEMAAEASADMHPVSVEFLVDGDKAVFYFEAEERIDFRELVRKLASHFHVRIDMRQIGVRDEARMVGGLGHCGQELCCKRLGGEFCPVSIRMAKEQDLSLNPQKISGVCGRLMCCLRYEFDVYKDFKERAPKMNATIDTPEGSARVTDLNVPREIVTLKLANDKTVKIPLAEMEPPEKGSRPHKVGEEAFDLHANQSPLDSVDLLAFSPFGDKSLTDGALRKDRQESDGDRARQGRSGQGSGGGRKPRRRTRSGKDGQGTTQSSSEGKAQNPNQQKKRSNQKNARPSDQSRPSGAPKDGQGGPGKGQGRSKRRFGKGASGSQGQGQGRDGASQERFEKQGQGPRPGQKSSGLRSGERRNPSGQPGGPAPAPQGRREQQGGTGAAKEHRRPRRRSHRSGGAESGGADEV
ncbi:MAG: hypothetical protein FWG23_03315 [Eggerthellaceae bacterium]|jgi:cell fate regulator YaaT (PSP1 superfamily)|nr:hypothetical protein [Eggerthellaceae bacterium]MDR2716266.1 hypothetical protein [Coriobacteriaceae bacterium]